MPPPQDYGAANPIADVFKRGYRAVNAVNDRVPDPPFSKRADTSWHDGMVREANRGFQQKAEVEAAATKRTSKRTAPRAAGKRR
jgi:hypothetical protein